jgi:hypothetical protein
MQVDDSWPDSEAQSNDYVEEQGDPKMNQKAWICCRTRRSKALVA